jgi:hypothetical protein
VTLSVRPPSCSNGFGLLCKLCGCLDWKVRIINHQVDLLRSRWWAFDPASLYRTRSARNPAFVVLGTRTCRLLAIQAIGQVQQHFFPLLCFSGTVSTRLLPKEPGLHSFPMRRQTPCLFAGYPALSRASSTVCCILWESVTATSWRVVGFVCCDFVS